VGVNAWAGTKTLYPTGSIDPTSTSAWQYHANITATQNTGYISFKHNANGVRCFYVNFYETGSDFYSTYDTYTVSFDFYTENDWTNTNGTFGEIVMYGEGAGFPSPLYNTFTAGTGNNTKKNYLLYLRGDGNWVETFKINGDEEKTVTFTKQTWQTVSITVKKSTGNVSYLITPQGSSTPITGGSGSYIADGEQTSFNCQGIFITLGKYLNKEIRIANVKVTTEVDEEMVSEPTITFKSVNDKKRVVTITGGVSTDSNPVTTYYTTDGSEPSLSSSSFTTATKDIEIGEGAESETTVTVKAMSVSSESTESSVASSDFTVGTMVPLGSVYIWFDKLAEGAGSTYNPVYKTSADAPALGNPEITLTATLNGSPVDLTDGAYTFTSSGTFRVVASAAGYESTENQIEVSNYSYIRTKTVNFKSLAFSSLSATEQSTYSTWNKALGSNAVYAFDLDDPNTSLVDGLSITNAVFCTDNSDGSSVRGIGCKGSNTTTTFEYLLAEGQISEFTTEKKSDGYADKYKPYTDGTESYTMSHWDILNGWNVYSPATVTATLGANGYATFAAPYALNLASLPDGLTAYKAETINGTNVHFTEVTEAVKANTGLLLAGAESGTYSIPVVASGADISGTNLLLVNETGAIFDEVSGHKYYAMVKDSDPLKFGWFDPATLAFPSTKAYLDVVSGSGAHLNVIFGEEETTGIETVNNGQWSMVNGQCFDLQGRRVAQPQKGLYIVNGKKVVIK